MVDILPLRSLLQSNDPIPIPSENVVRITVKMEAEEDNNSFVNVGNWVIKVAPMNQNQEIPSTAKNICFLWRVMLRIFCVSLKKLAEMITEITKAQLLAWRLGTLMNEGKATPAQISMAKRNNVAMALNIAREARQIFGGMGITNEYPIMRHMMNLETVLTYEGTHDVHLLITGMDITGINAFK